MPTPLQSTFISPHHNQFLFSDHCLDEFLPQDARWQDAWHGTRAFAAWLCKVYARVKKSTAAL